MKVRVRLQRATQDSDASPVTSRERLGEGSADSRFCRFVIPAPGRREKNPDSLLRIRIPGAPLSPRPVRKAVRNRRGRLSPRPVRARMKVRVQLQRATHLARDSRFRLSSTAHVSLTTGASARVSFRARQMLHTQSTHSADLVPCFVARETNVRPYAPGHLVASPSDQ
jgi:hypothetical protein